MKEQSVKPPVVILVGPPGVGKDTQAGLLVREFGMTQIPSSQIIQEKFAEHPDDPVIRREREKYDAGLLNDPKLVGQWIMEYVGAVLSDSKGLVFSGSPRTISEGQVEIDGLDKLVGIQGVVVIHMTLDERLARDRILKRKFCRANKHVIPAYDTPELTTCPWDGSELYVRDLDSPALLDKRFQEYREKTLPTIELLRASGAPFYVIDGSQSVEAAHHEIVDILQRRRAPAPLA